MTLVITAHTTWHHRTLGTVVKGELQPYTNPDDAEDQDFVEADDDVVDQEGDDDDVPGGDTVEKELKAEGRQARMKQKEERLASVNKQRMEKGREPIERAVLINRNDPLRTYSSRCLYKFKRVVIDEAHVLRNPDTLYAESLYQTRKEFLHFLTATPMLNHPKDLRGYLHQIFKPWWSLDIYLGFQDMYFKGFDPRRAKSRDDMNHTREVNLLPEITEDPKTRECQDAWDADQTRLFILCPRQYNATGKKYGWSANLCAIMLPPVLEMLLCRIGYETKISLEDGNPALRVGDQIPRCNVYTVQLEMNPTEKKRYEDQTLHLLGLLGAPPNEASERVAISTPQLGEITSNFEDTRDDSGGNNAGVYRFLKHATMDPRLAKMTELNHRGMTRSEKALATKRRKNNWTGKDFDHGASYFHYMTRADYSYDTPRDRLAMAQYLVAFSVKLRYAMGILAENIEAKKKTVLVFEFPMPLW